MRRLVFRLSALAAVTALAGPGVAAEMTAKPAAIAMTSIPAIPADQAARYQKYLAVLQPSVKSWVESQAKVEMKSPAPDLNALTAAVKARFAASPVSGVANSSAAIPGGADIEALAFIVLMQATNDMDQDLQGIMSEVQEQTNAKQQLRQELQALSDDAAGRAGKAAAAVCETPGCIGLVKALPALNQTLAQNKQPQISLSGSLTTAAVNSAIQALQNAENSLNDLSQSAQMQLQQVMDQRSKFEEAMANIMKNFSDTADSIISNLK